MKNLILMALLVGCNKEEIVKKVNVDSSSAPYSVKYYQYSGSLTAGGFGDGYVIIEKSETQTHLTYHMPTDSGYAIKEVTLKPREDSNSYLVIYQKDKNNCHSSTFKDFQGDYMTGVDIIQGRKTYSLTEVDSKTFIDATSEKCRL